MNIRIIFFSFIGFFVAIVSYISGYEKGFEDYIYINSPSSAYNEYTELQLILNQDFNVLLEKKRENISNELYYWGRYQESNKALITEKMNSSDLERQEKFLVPIAFYLRESGQYDSSNDVEKLAPKSDSEEKFKKFLVEKNEEKRAVVERVIQKYAE